MASTDKKNVISSLIESGKAKGKLSTKDITDALEELDLSLIHILWTSCARWAPISRWTARLRSSRE